MITNLFNTYNNIKLLLLYSAKNEQVKLNCLEIIKYNYINTQDPIKIKKIENLILKFFSSLILCYDSLEEINCFSLLISEMCQYTTDITFYQKLINILYVAHFYNLDEKNAKNSKLI